MGMIISQVITGQISCACACARASATWGRVSLNAAGERLVERVRPKSRGRATHGPLTLRLGLCDEDALRILLATLAALDRGDVLMVWHLLNARTPNQIAKAEGLTRQALHARIRKFVGRHPDLAALYGPMRRTHGDLASAMVDDQGTGRDGGSVDGQITGGGVRSRDRDKRKETDKEGISHG